MAYSVLSGETIQDAAFNITGSLAGIDPLLELNTPQNVPMVDWKTMQDRMDVPDSNFMETYTPDLYAGQLFDTDGLVVENLDATLGRRFNSSMQNPTQVKAEIDELWSKLFPPSLADLPIGYNLRGKTIRFLDTDTLTMTYAPDESAYFVMIESWGGVVGLPVERPDGTGNYLFIGIQEPDKAVLIFGAEDPAIPPTWVNTEYVMPDDQDCIVSLSNLADFLPSKGWDFSHTEII